MTVKQLFEKYYHNPAIVIAIVDEYCRVIIKERNIRRERSHNVGKKHKIRTKPEIMKETESSNEVK